MTSFQATLVNTGFGQLVLRDNLGKVAQKWTLSNPKCVIGSGTNCNVSCQLPGLADQHVLMVIGAKQVFLRALAAGLTRHGQTVGELVVSGNESQFNFEICGHLFQYSREAVSTPVTKDFVKEVPQARPSFVAAANDIPPLSPAPNYIATPTASNTQEVLPVSRALTPARLKFTVVRALEKNRESNPGLSTLGDSGLNAGRPAWVEAIVRDALRPVEERLDDLNGPLQSIERRLRRQRAQMRKARQQRQERTASDAHQMIPVLAPELIQSQAAIEQCVQSQATQLERVTQNVGQVIARLSDMDQQLSLTQADRQELSEQFQQSNQQIANLHREMTTMFHGLQSHLNQSTSSDLSTEARLWQSNIEAQLAELQATLLSLDDVKTTLQAAVEQNRLLKDDIANQQQKLGKLITESVHKAITDTAAQSNQDSETIGQVVGDKVCDSLREQLGTRFTKEIAQQLADSLNNDFALPLTQQLSNQLSNQLTGEMNRQFISAQPAAPAAIDSQEIVESLRAAIAEVLAPLAGTLQSNLQQSIQQAVDQTVQQSLQNSLQQQLPQPIQPSSPMQSVASLAHLQALAAQAPVEYPNIQVPVQARSLEPVEQIQPVEQLQQPIEPTYPSSPVSDSQAYDSQAYDSQAYDSQAYDSQAYDSQAYDSQAYESKGYDSQAYDPQSEPHQGFDSQPYRPVGYQAPVESAPVDEAPIQDSQAYPATAYDSQPLEREEMTSDYSAYYEQPQSTESPSAESHAQELPSWWSDDPMEQPSGAASVHDSNYDAMPSVSGSQAYEPITSDSNHPDFDSSMMPLVNRHADDQASENEEGYAESAFSSEQLELGISDSQRYDENVAPAAEALPYSAFNPASPRRDQDEYDSVPYSELVNRKPEYREEVADAEVDATDNQGDFASDYPTYDSQLRDSALVPAGHDSEFLPGGYAEPESEAYADIAQPEHLTQSVPAADNPTVPASAARAGEENDESVEDYMRRLLARMRGVSETEVPPPPVEAPKVTQTSAPKDPSVADTVQNVDAGGEQISEAWTEPFDPDKYVPRGTAPEKNRDLNAMRELANTSARSAIQVSARRRQGTAILIKSSIALVGLIAGVALVSINGARINIAFIATVASFLVTTIWGYDAVTSIRPLIQANRGQKKQQRDADKSE